MWLEEKDEDEGRLFANVPSLHADGVVNESTSRKKQTSWRIPQVAASLPCLGQVHRATGHPRKIVWMTISLVCIFLSVLQSTIIFTQYYEYPVTVTVSSTSHAYLNSPAITICPTARVSCSRLASVLLQDIKDSPSQSSINPSQTLSDPSISTFAPNNTGNETLESKLPAKSPLLQLFNISGCCDTLVHKLSLEDLRLLECKLPGSNLHTPGQGRLVTSYSTFEGFLKLISKINLKEREQFLLQLDQTIVSCRLDGDDCMGEIRRTPPNSLVSQGCFTVFGELDGQRGMDLSVCAPGSSSGVTLLLKTDLGDYPSSGIAESSGFLVQLHSRRLPSDANELGFLVSPGTVTKVSTALKTETRLTAPYPSKCMYDWKETSFSPLVWIEGNFTKSNESYSLYECLNMCYQWSAITVCGCVDIRFRINFVITHGNVSVYDMLQKMKQCGVLERHCTRKFQNQIYRSTDTDCPCNVECRGHIFDKTLSSATFPTPTYKDNFYKAHNLSKNTGVAVLQVFYSTLERQLVAEQPKYEDISTLVSNIGGICGAYLGLSIIAFIELVDMICQAAVNMIF